MLNSLKVPGFCFPMSAEPWTSCHLCPNNHEPLLCARSLVRWPDWLITFLPWLFLCHLPLPSCRPGKLAPQEGIGGRWGLCAAPSGCLALPGQLVWSRAWPASHWTQGIVGGAGAAGWGWTSGGGKRRKKALKVQDGSRSVCSCPLYPYTWLCPS